MYHKKYMIFAVEVLSEERKGEIKFIPDQKADWTIFRQKLIIN